MAKSRTTVRNQAADRQLVADDYGALYSVRVNGESKAFELILGRQTKETADFTLRIRLNLDRLTNFEEQLQ